MMTTRIIFVVVAGLLGIFNNASKASAGMDGPKIGARPPALNLSQVMQGAELRDVTWERLKGKVVVLEFWNTRCGPCISAIPHLNALAEQFSNRPVVFLAVTDDNADHAKDFLLRKPMNAWVAIDGALGATREAFDVVGIPHTVIVAPAGNIAAITHPAKLKAEHLEEVLSGKPCSLPPPEPIADNNDEEVSVAAVAKPRILEFAITGPFPRPRGAFNSIAWNESHTEFQAEKAYLRNALSGYFGINEKFVVETAKLPDGLYNIKVFGPTNWAMNLKAQFRSAFEAAFGLSVQTNQCEVEVYVMTRGDGTNAPNLKLATKPGGGGGQPGGFRLNGSRMDSIAWMFQDKLDRPVINEVASTNLWGADLRWKMTAGELFLSGIGHKKLDEELLELIFSETAPKDTPQKVLAAAKAKLSPEDFATLSNELAKPVAQRFQPDPAAVVQAAHEQLGLELRLAKRVVTILEVTRLD
ncbi:MAG: redoxin domain-containing protein [Verrucomicrobiota bacterium]